MVAWLCMMLACRVDAPATSSPAPGTSTTPAGDTALPAPTTPPVVATADTAVPTDTGTPPPEPVDCAAYVPQATLTKVPTALDHPVYMSPRADGDLWYQGGHFGYGTNGVYLGADLSTGSRIYPGAIEMLHEDLGGTLHVVIDDVLYRSVNEGPLEPVVDPIYPGVSAHSDVAVHPSGTVVLATYVLDGTHAHALTVAHADGSVLQWDAADVGLYRVRAVAYDADRSHLWLLDGALYRVAVDADGVPDWATLAEEPTPASPAWRSGGDLVVDACDGLWLLADLSYGFGGLLRYDPATGTQFEVPGNVDQGYGSSALRFGRAPGQEHLLATLAGGWNSPVRWYVWDVGLGEAPWP